jgi:hypothetical protein
LPSRAAQIPLRSARDEAENINPIRDDLRTVVMRPALVVTADPRGMVRPWRPGEPVFVDAPEGVTIGRLRGELRITWDSMQRRMCRVFVDAEGRACIGDVNSRGGAFVNHVELPSFGEPHVLQPGDVVGFGSWGAHEPNCPVVLRFDLLDPEPLARVKRVGPWWVVDGNPLDGPVQRHAFRPGRDGLLHLVSTEQGADDSWVDVAGVRRALPPVVDFWGDGRLVYRAFAWNGGVRIGTLLEVLGEGRLDPPVAARILLEVDRAMAAAFDGARQCPELWDLHVGWDGAVVMLPRPMFRWTGDHPSADALAALFHALVPDGRARLDDRPGFVDVDAAIRRFVDEVGEVADDAALAGLVRGACPREHEADLILLEQIRLLPSEET